MSVKPYGCHNRTFEKVYFAPTRIYGYGGIFSYGVTRITHRLSTDCKYDKSATDPRCAGCKHIKEIENV